MIRDIALLRHQGKQTAPPTEDQAGDPLVPEVTGGKVIVTAHGPEGYVEFEADVTDQVFVGAKAHVRLDFVPSVD
jgi:hypothetical protein